MKCDKLNAYLNMLAFYLSLLLCILAPCNEATFPRNITISSHAFLAHRKLEQASRSGAAGSATGPRDSCTVYRIWEKV